MAHTEVEDPTYGLLAEFETADQLIGATKKANEAGYRRMDGFSPYPLPGVADAMGFKFSEMAIVMLLGGLIGGTAGFLMQYWTQSMDYAVNVGGRPYNSWPAFIPVTFETTILTTALTGVFGLIALCGLPMPYHPLFNIKRFERASQDRFFLCIEAADEKFDIRATREFLEGLGPVAVEEVPK